MSRRWLRLLGPLLAVLAAAAVVYECFARREGPASLTYVVTVESADEHPVREARFAWLTQQRQMDEFIGKLDEEDTVEFAAEESTYLISDRAFAVSGLGYRTRSPAGITADRYSFYPWVAIFVELEDGSRWAKVEPVPDPHGPRQIVCRLDAGRQFRPPQR